MSYPRLPNEAERLRELQDLAILDTRSTEALKRAVTFAKDTFQVPIAALTLLDEDRQLLYACDGLDAEETPRDVAFCNYTIVQDDISEVTDTWADERFAHHPLVIGEPGIRYYAGVPVQVRKYPIGAFCLVGFEPRPALSLIQRRLLEYLAMSVARELDLCLQIKEAAALLGNCLANSGGGPR